MRDGKQENIMKLWKWSIAVPRGPHIIRLYSSRVLKWHFVNDTRPLFTTCFSLYLDSPALNYTFILMNHFYNLHVPFNWVLIIYVFNCWELVLCSQKQGQIFLSFRFQYLPKGFSFNGYKLLTTNKNLAWQRGKFNFVLKD